MSDELRDALSPLLAVHGLEVVDVELGPGKIRVTVDRPGGVDLEGLAQANRAVSGALDELDPIPGRYTLEVSSPGVERRLRTPEQFARAVGETVSVRTLPSTGEVRRVQGRLAEADDVGFRLETTEVAGGSLRLAYADVERARTIFEWGAKPAPSPSRRPPGKKGGATHRSAGAAGNPKDAKERVTTP